MRSLVMIGCTALLVSCTTLAPLGGTTESQDGESWNPPAALDGRALSGSAAIPDGDPTGVTLGPISVMGDGDTIEDIGLSLSISHECTGDLAVWLCYDADNDGSYDASAPVEFYRGRLGGYSAPEPFADPKSLDGVYFFRGDACSVFNGLGKGGSFYLVVADALEECAGQVRAWTVHVDTSRAGTDLGLAVY